MSTEPRPRLRVVRGEPTDAEVAALLTVLTARSAAARSAAVARSAGRARSTWADPARQLRVTGRPGPAAWRRSALPS